MTRNSPFITMIGTDFFLIFIGIFPFVATTISLFLLNPLPWPDEAIFLNTAQTIQKTGIVATSVFGNAIPGLATHALWYPPLFFYLLSQWISLFGSTLEAIRMLSVILALISLCLFFYLVKILFVSRKLALIGTLLLAADYAFSQAGRVARMDMLSFLFLLAALLSYFLMIKKKDLLLCIPGAISALAILTHPLGFIAPVVLVFHVLISKESVSKKIRRIVFFLLPIVVLQALWIFSIRNELGLLTIQYGLQFARKATEVPFAFTFFDMSFAWKIMVTCYALLLFLFLKKQMQVEWTRRNIFFLFGLLVSVFALMWGKEFWYLLYFQPFITLIYLSLLQEKHHTALFIYLIVPLGVILFCTSIFLSFAKASAADDYHAFTTQLRAALPTRGTIFLSVIPDPYFDLQKNTGYTFYEFPTVPVSNTAYLTLLNNSDYIIANFADNPLLTKYIAVNKASMQPVAQSQRFGAYVVTLLPKNKRKVSF